VNFGRLASRLIIPGEGNSGLMLLKPAWGICLISLVLHFMAPQAGAAMVSQKRELRLTLSQTLSMAVKNNRDLKTARRALSLAASNYRGAKDAYYPFVTANLAASQTMNNQVIVDPWVVYNFATGLNVSLNWPLDLSGAIGRNVQQALITLIKSKASYVLTAQNLVVTVYNQYYALLGLRETLAIDLAQVNQTKEQLRIAQERLKAGRVPESDVLTSTVQYDNSRQTLKRDEGLYENAKAQLRNTLVIKQNVEIIPTDRLTFTPETVNFEDAAAVAVKDRLEMQSARLSLEAARISLKSTYDQYMPKFSISGFWGYNTQGRNPDDAFRQQNRPLEPSWSISGGITIPLFIFDGGVIKESKVRAMIGIEQAEADVHQTKDKVVLEVKNAIINLQNAQEQVNIVKNSIKLAKESVRIAELRYRMGLTGYLETTDARNNLKTAETNLLTAVIQANLSKVALDQAMGKPLVKAWPVSE
jgi:outer membrane protein TolC